MEGAPWRNLIKPPKAKPTKIVVNFWPPAGGSRSSLLRRSRCSSPRRCIVRRSLTPVAVAQSAEVAAFTGAGAFTKAVVFTRVAAGAAAEVPKRSLRVKHEGRPLGGLLHFKPHLQ